MLKQILFVFQFQSSFMGCTFDCFTTSWNSRSYLITLLIVAWVIPLIIILNSHLRIIIYLRKANIQNLCMNNIQCRLLKRNSRAPEEEESSCGDTKCFPHVTGRVSQKLHIQIYRVVGEHKVELRIMSQRIISIMFVCSF